MIKSPPPPMPATARPARRLWIPGALASLLAAIVYLNVFGNPFVYDDYHLVVENRAIVPPLYLKALLWKDLSRPIANISFAIDRALFGPEPFGFHLTNVVLHLVNVALLFTLAHGLARDRIQAGGPMLRSRADPVTVAAVAATLFAVHPMMTEAVGYISGRSDVLGATWFLAALLSARRWMRAGGRVAMVMTLVLLAGGLATKETTAMFALVVLACDRLVLPGTIETRARRWKRLHAPLLVATAAVAMARVAFLVAVEHGDKPAIVWSLVPVELDVVGRYLGLLVLPVRQSVFHEVSFPTVLSAGVFVTVGLIAWCLTRIWRRGRADGLTVFGMLWFLLLLVPSTALVLLNRGEPMAEHRVYLASCGFFLAAGALAGRAESFVLRRRLVTRLVVAVGVVAAVSWLGARTVLRNAEWSSPIALWSDAVDLAPDSWVPRVSLGEALHRANRHGDAIVQFAAALQRRPDEPAVYVKLAACLAEVGRLDAARQQFVYVEKITPGMPEATNGLGTVALLSGDSGAARRFFQSTLDQHPENIAARLGLASVAEAPGGDPAEAIRWCDEIHRMAPETPGIDACLERNRQRLQATRP